MQYENIVYDNDNNITKIKTVTHQFIENFLYKILDKVNIVTYKKNKPHFVAFTYGLDFFFETYYLYYALYQQFDQIKDIQSSIKLLIDFKQKKYAESKKILLYVLNTLHNFNSNIINFKYLKFQKGYVGSNFNIFDYNATKIHSHVLYTVFKQSFLTDDYLQEIENRKNTNTYIQSFAIVKMVHNGHDRLL